MFNTTVVIIRVMSLSGYNQTITVHDNTLIESFTCQRWEPSVKTWQLWVALTLCVHLWCSSSCWHICGSGLLPVWVVAVSFRKKNIENRMYLYKKKGLLKAVCKFQQNQDFLSGCKQILHLFYDRSLLYFFLHQLGHVISDSGEMIK